MFLSKDIMFTRKFTRYSILNILKNKEKKYELRRQQR